MGRIGFSYGSEWNLLRFLGYHRDDLNRQIEETIAGGKVLDWLPARYETDPAKIQKPPFSLVLNPRKSTYVGRPRRLDAEWKGIEFLTGEDRKNAQPAWASYWPQRGNPPNWDAVALIKVGGQVQWLLVEAKSHLQETMSGCKASERGGRETILNAFQSTAAHMEVEVDVERWMSPHYQYANRLAVLSFLMKQGIQARLLFVYFLGDKFPQGRPEVCPSTSQEWTPQLKAMELQIGWKPENRLAAHVHKLFLDVCPMPSKNQYQGALAR